MEWVYHGPLTRIEGGKAGYYRRYKRSTVPMTRFHLLLYEMAMYALGAVASVGLVMFIIATGI